MSEAELGNRGKKRKDGRGQGRGSVRKSKSKKE